jgi:hypothetical protein
MGLEKTIIQCLCCGNRIKDEEKTQGNSRNLVLLPLFYLEKTIHLEDLVVKKVCVVRV